MHMIHFHVVQPLTDTAMFGSSLFKTSQTLVNFMSPLLYKNSSYCIMIPCSWSFVLQLPCLSFYRINALQDVINTTEYKHLHTYTQICVKSLFECRSVKYMSLTILSAWEYIFFVEIHSNLYSSIVLHVRVIFTVS